MEGGERRGEEGSAELTEAPYATLLSSGRFQAGREQRGASEGFFFFSSHSLVRLSCGFAELPCVGSCTHIRSSRPLSCLTCFTLKRTSVVLLFQSIQAGMDVQAKRELNQSLGS